MSFQLMRKCLAKKYDQREKEKKMSFFQGFSAHTKMFSLELKSEAQNYP